MEMEITSVRRSRLMHQLFSEEGLAERREGEDHGWARGIRRE